MYPIRAPLLLEAPCQDAGNLAADNPLRRNSSKRFVRFRHFTRVAQSPVDIIRDICASCTEIFFPVFARVASLGRIIAFGHGISCGLRLDFVVPHAWLSTSQGLHSLRMYAQ